MSHYQDFRASILLLLVVGLPGYSITTPVETERTDIWFIVIADLIDWGGTLQSSFQSERMDKSCE